MGDFHGKFVWYELMTPDTAGAKAFYGKVLGWGTQAAPVSDIDYTLFTAGESPVAGVMEVPQERRAAGAPPTWLGYVGVNDVDATAVQAERLGATIYVPPSDIPTVGRSSVFADPQKAIIAVFKPLAGCDSPSPEPPPGTPGRIGWHELLAVGWQAVLPFYAELFGWQKGEAMDMGEADTYQLFALGERTLGGMFNKPPAAPGPAWQYYFNVEDIDAAVSRVTANGGQICNGPMQVPGGSWIVQGVDPQGASFALVGPRG
jgi:uncharacterized protein